MTFHYFGEEGKETLGGRRLGMPIERERRGRTGKGLLRLRYKENENRNLHENRRLFSYFSSWKGEERRRYQFMKCRERATGELERKKKKGLSDG